MLGVDEGARVERQQRQNRSSAHPGFDAARCLVAHDSRSGAAKRRLSSAPDARLIGSSRATTRPRGANDPVPQAAMLHRIEEVGEAPRGPPVALTSGIRSDYQISRLAHGSSQRLATLVLAPLTSYGMASLPDPRRAAQRRSETIEMSVPDADPRIVDSVGPGGNDDEADATPPTEAALGTPRAQGDPAGAQWSSIVVDALLQRRHPMSPVALLEVGPAPVAAGDPGPALR